MQQKLKEGKVNWKKFEINIKGTEYSAYYEEIYEEITDYNKNYNKNKKAICFNCGANTAFIL